MTTTVIVKAKHGWPVRVTAFPPPAAPDTPVQALWAQIVPNGTEREFHVHSGADLLIHEIQPAELASEAKGTPDEQASFLPPAEAASAIDQSPGERVAIDDGWIKRNGESTRPVEAVALPATIPSNLNDLLDLPSKE